MDDREPPTVLHLVRVSIEAISPLSPATGETGLHDVVLNRDANGLPEIAGASIQGVLRHLYSRRFGEEKEQELFGHGDEGEEEGAGAQSGAGKLPEVKEKVRTGRLFFGFAKVHDKNNRAVSSPLAATPLLDTTDDDILGRLGEEAPLVRDHVRLAHTHAVDGRGKFDRVAVPAGTRFSFEMSMWGAAGEVEPDRLRLEELLSLMQHPAFRLGGATRRGYGGVKVIAARHRAIDVSKADLAALRCLRQQAPSTLDAEDFEDLRLEQQPEPVTISVDLTPVGFWRVGATGLATRTGSTGLKAQNSIVANRLPGRRAKDVDAAPIREPRIDWSGDVATWEQPRALRASDDASASTDVRWPKDARETLVVPASAIKGPLAHRAVFHWNRLLRPKPVTVDDLANDARAALAEKDPQKREEDLTDVRRKVEKCAQRSAALVALLGTEKDKANEAEGRGEKGAASRVLVDDIQVEVGEDEIGVLDHNSIDRFTGGVRNSILYSEEVVFLRPQQKLMVRIRILPEPKLRHGAEQPMSTADRALARRALVEALRDLCEGRLALGAKSMGFCTGPRPTIGGSGPEKAGWEAALKEAWPEAGSATGGAA